MKNVEDYVYPLKAEWDTIGGDYTYRPKNPYSKPYEKIVIEPEPAQIKIDKEIAIKDTASDYKKFKAALDLIEQSVEVKKAKNILKISCEFFEGQWFFSNLTDNGWKQITEALFKSIFENHDFTIEKVENGLLIFVCEVNTVDSNSTIENLSKEK